MVELPEIQGSNKIYMRSSMYLVAYFLWIDFNGNIGEEDSKFVKHHKSTEQHCHPELIKVTTVVNSKLKTSNSVFNSIFDTKE
jgi:hypothetical protein